MATCDIGQLLSDACGNRFLCLDSQLSKAIELQLLKAASGSDSSIGQLLADACSNGYSCLSYQDSKAVQAQFLCNMYGGGGVECVNLIPDGAQYLSEHYEVPGLIEGNSYTITFGPNDALLNITPPIANPGNDTPIPFTAESVNDLVSEGIGNNVTAIICAI